VFCLLLTNNSTSSSETREHSLVYVRLSYFTCFSEVLQMGTKCRDDVCVYFEANASHTNWVLDVLLSIELIRPRSNLKYLAISRQLDYCGRFFYSIKVCFSYLMAY